MAHTHRTTWRASSPSVQSSPAQAFHVRSASSYSTHPAQNVTTHKCTLRSQANYHSLATTSTTTIRSIIPSSSQPPFFQDYNTLHNTLPYTLVASRRAREAAPTSRTHWPQPRFGSLKLLRQFGKDRLLLMHQSHGRKRLTVPYAPCTQRGDKHTTTTYIMRSRTHSQRRTTMASMRTPSSV